MERLPVVFATYPGDVTHMVGQRVGPNTLGEYLWAVTADFNPKSKKTHVGFTYMPPREQVGTVER